jgi:hypothetical protein
MSDYPPSVAGNEPQLLTGEYPCPVLRPRQHGQGVND